LKATIEEAKSECENLTKQKAELIEASKAKKKGLDEFESNRQAINLQLQEL
jgi:hypothetical protein